MIYLTVAGEFNGDVFSFAVFAVDFVNIPSLELIQETDSGLCHVIAVRNDIVYLAHMVQVFDETDIEFIRDFHIELLYGTERLQSCHFSHEFDVLGRDRLCEQIAFVAIFPF